MPRPRVKSGGESSELNFLNLSMKRCLGTVVSAWYNLYVAIKHTKCRPLPLFRDKARTGRIRYQCY